jgi:hypothetical protein
MALPQRIGCLLPRSESLLPRRGALRAWDRRDPGEEREKGKAVTAEVDVRALLRADFPPRPTRQIFMKLVS